METKVLVGYASKYGSTAEIAERIGKVLRDEGLQVDVLPAEQVGDPAGYQAVLVGSALYAGQWRKQAAQFLKDNEAKLAALPVYIFSSGPTGEGDVEELMAGWTLPSSLQPVVERIKPRDMVIFHGNADSTKLSLADKLILKMVKAPSGDFRDWDAIAAWARSIAAGLSSG